MFDDPHLLASGGLEPVTLPDGRETMLPLLPIEIGGKRLGTSPTIPEVGGNSDNILTALGFDAEAIAAFRINGVVG
jgi:crotonobetainyl-CoA:carnitine CoA-transferase CaiB-like acyl-CoA transferase